MSLGIDPDRFAALPPEQRRSFMELWERAGFLCAHGTPSAWCGECGARRRVKRRAARARRILRSYAERKKPC